jgi:hypothetical protein
VLRWVAHSIPPSGFIRFTMWKHMWSGQKVYSISGRNVSLFIHDTREQ